MIKTLLLASALVFGADASSTEVVSEPIVSVDETSEVITTETTTTTEIITTEDISKAEEEVKGKLTEFLDKYLDKNTVANIINWCIDAGVLSALAILLVKYRKFKVKTIEQIVDEVKNALEKYLKECFDKLSDEQIAQIKEAISHAGRSVDHLKKVIYLLNSKDANDKITALEILAESVKDEKEKEKINEVKDQVVKEQEQKQKTLDKVKDDYSSID